MLTGERRWISARRGGMTVLGKVTVPKPINLPSQRLENHGLDPNVEIVPKGTLNWGTRPSPSAQNPWTTPVQSPPESGGTGSPSHLNGRPSSGGTGTRPSTAGSDRSHEPVSNAWGASSRPSSASGVVTTNQTPVTAARPRSAEPRPASSQLSRFAEPTSENSVTWGAPGTMDKLGVSSSKNKDFSLTSGDFPTLGSEKAADTLVRQGHSSQSRPVSASGRTATPKKRSEVSPCEDGSINASQETGVVNTLKNENVLDVEAGDPPSMEGWQREMMYSNQHMPQQFRPWHGNSPHNPPNGVWYRGPFGGGPYAPPGLPGSYPHEPFGYYHPRLPARPTSNMQPVLQPGSAPSGYFPDKGDSHRPHMPDSFIQPVVPFGPGPFPVQVPCDGYYGPPHMGSCIPGERRPPIMGMATAPCVYNRYPIQSTHPDSGNFRGPSGYGPSSTRTKEQGMSGHSHGPRQGPYKVLLKHQDGWDETDGKEKRDHSVSIEKDNRPGPPSRVIGLVAEHRRDDHVGVSKVSSVAASSQYADSHEGHSSAPVGLNIPERTSKVNTFDDSLVRKQEATSVAGEDLQQLMSIKRNPTLIEKIETLNNKARMSDGRYDERLKSLKASSFQSEDAPHKTTASMNDPCKDSSSGMFSTPIYEGNATEKKVDESTLPGPDVSSSVNVSQASASVLNASNAVGVIHHNAPIRPHVIQGRSDNRGKGRSNPPTKDEEWRKKPLAAEFSGEGSSKKDDTFDDSVLNHHPVLRVSEKSSLIQGKAGGDLSAYDPSDHQRAKIKEIVAERAKQLQKEEEERTREQKARALAKLEELNRRMLAESSSEKVEHVLPQTQVSQYEQESFHINTTPKIVTNTAAEVGSPVSGCNSDTAIQISGCVTHSCEGLEVPIEGRHAQPDRITTNNFSSQLQQKDVKEASDHKTSQGRDGMMLKQKQIAHKRKQTISKNSSDKLVSSGESVQPKVHADVAGDINSPSGESSPKGSTKVADDYSLKHKKKNSRGKNKHKLDEVLSAAPKVVPVDGDSVKALAELNKLKTSVSVFEVGSVQVPFSIEIAESQDSEIPCRDLGWSLPSEEVQSVVNNQVKSHPRRVPKNTQASRTTEKFHAGDSVVWAPVGSLKKTEVSENINIEVHTTSGVGRVAQSNNKSRRAEMERYVPKPVAQEAKELSVQGSTEQRVSSFVNQTASTELTGMTESISLNKETCAPDNVSSGKVELPVVNKTGEVKHNKHGKTHGLWRPRVSGESAVQPSPEESAVQPSPEESSYSSAPNRISQKSLERHRNPKAEISFTKEQTKDPENSTASDGPISKETVTDLATKDHGVISRGRRQPFKGYKGGGNMQNDWDQCELHRQDMFEDGSQFSLETNKLVEKHAAETHPPSHWQPKSQVYSAPIDQGSSRANGGQRVPNRVGKGTKREYPTQRGEHLFSRNDKNSQTLVQPPSDKTNEQKPPVTWVPNVHHETKTERKVDSNPVKSKDPSHNVNNQHEQPFSGLRRQSHQNRFTRVNEVPHGTQNPRVQDLPSSSDRQRHDSQYEYQKGRSIVNERIDSCEEVPRVTGSRYRERGQTHSRHGGSDSNARNSGTPVVAAGSCNRESNP